MGREIDTKIRNKHRAWDPYKRSKTLKHWENHTRERNLASKVVNKAKKNFENKIVQEEESNPQNFWNYVKYKTAVSLPM